jgi:hypothetical protein
LCGLPSGSSTPPDAGQVLTPEGSLSRHVLPSPPSHLDPLGAPCRCPHFEMQVTPRTATINKEEAGLANALVISVGGTRSLIGPDQVRAHLGRFFQVQEQDVSVSRYGEEDFH